MSLEAAKKLLNEVKREDFAQKSQEELEQFLKENDYDCTLEEVKKAYILAEPMSEKELEKVSGGIFFDRKNCAGDYYVEQCSDTVEENSHCWSGDYGCTSPGRDYTCTKTHLEPRNSGGLKPF